MAATGNQPVTPSTAPGRQDSAIEMENEHLKDILEDLLAGPEEPQGRGTDAAATRFQANAAVNRGGYVDPFAPSQLQSTTPAGGHNSMYFAEPPSNGTFTAHSVQPQPPANSVWFTQSAQSTNTSIAGPSNASMSASGMNTASAEYHPPVGHVMHASSLPVGQVFIATQQQPQQQQQQYNAAGHADHMMHGHTRPTVIQAARPQLMQQLSQQHHPHQVGLPGQPPSPFIVSGPMVTHVHQQHQQQPPPPVAMNRTMTRSGPPQYSFPSAPYAYSTAPTPMHPGYFPPPPPPPPPPQASIVQSMLQSGQLKRIQIPVEFLLAHHGGGSQRGTQSRSSSVPVTPSHPGSDGVRPGTDVPNANISVSAVEDVTVEKPGSHQFITNLSIGNTSNLSFQVSTGMPSSTAFNNNNSIAPETIPGSKLNDTATVPGEFTAQSSHASIHGGADDDESAGANGGALKDRGSSSFATTPPPEKQVTAHPVDQHHGSVSSVSGVSTATNNNKCSSQQTGETVYTPTPDQVRLFIGNVLYELSAEGLRYVFKHVCGADIPVGQITVSSSNHGHTPVGPASGGTPSGTATTHDKITTGPSPDATKFVVPQPSYMTAHHDKSQSHAGGNTPVTASPNCSFAGPRSPRVEKHGESLLSVNMGSSMPTTPLPETSYQKADAADASDTKSNADSTSPQAAGAKASPSGSVTAGLMTVSSSTTPKGCATIYADAVAAEKLLEWNQQIYVTSNGEVTFGSRRDMQTASVELLTQQGCHKRSNSQNIGTPSSKGPKNFMVIERSTAIPTASTAPPAYTGNGVAHERPWQAPPNPNAAPYTPAPVPMGQRYFIPGAIVAPPGFQPQPSGYAAVAAGLRMAHQQQQQQQQLQHAYQQQNTHGGQGTSAPPQVPPPSWSSTMRAATSGNAVNHAHASSQSTPLPQPHPQPQPQPQVLSGGVVTTSTAPPSASESDTPKTPLTSLPSAPLTPPPFPFFRYPGIEAVKLSVAQGLVQSSTPTDFDTVSNSNTRTSGVALEGPPSIPSAPPSIPSAPPSIPRPPSYGGANGSFASIADAANKQLIANPAEGELSRTSLSPPTVGNSAMNFAAASSKNFLNATGVTGGSSGSPTPSSGFSQDELFVGGLPYEADGYFVAWMVNHAITASSGTTSTMTTNTKMSGAEGSGGGRKKSKKEVAPADEDGSGPETTVVTTTVKTMTTTAVPELIITLPDRVFALEPKSNHPRRGGSSAPASSTMLSDSQSATPTPVNPQPPSGSSSPGFHIPQGASPNPSGVMTPAAHTGCAYVLVEPAFMDRLLALNKRIFCTPVGFYLAPTRMDMDRYVAGTLMPFKHTHGAMLQSSLGGPAAASAAAAAAGVAAAQQEPVVWDPVNNVFVSTTVTTTTVTTVDGKSETTTTDSSAAVATMPGVAALHLLGPSHAVVLERRHRSGSLGSGPSSNPKHQQQARDRAAAAAAMHGTPVQSSDNTSTPNSNSSPPARGSNLFSTIKGFFTPKPTAAPAPAPRLGLGGAPRHGERGNVPPPPDYNHTSAVTSVPTYTPGTTLVYDPSTGEQRTIYNTVEGGGTAQILPGGHIYYTAPQPQTTTYLTPDGMVISGQVLTRPMAFNGGGPQAAQRGMYGGPSGVPSYSTYPQITINHAPAPTWAPTAAPDNHANITMRTSTAAPAQPMPSPTPSYKRAH